MKNVSSRLSRIEQSIRNAVPAYDWTASPTYAQMSEEDRQRLHGYAERLQADGLAQFTLDELNDFELLVLPFAKEEADG